MTGAIVHATLSQVGWMLAFVTLHGLIAFPLYLLALRSRRRAQVKEGG